MNFVDQLLQNPTRQGSFDDWGYSSSETLGWYNDFWHKHRRGPNDNSPYLPTQAAQNAYNLKIIESRLNYGLNAVGFIWSLPNTIYGAIDNRDKADYSHFDWNDFIFYYQITNPSSDVGGWSSGHTVSLNPWEIKYLKNNIWNENVSLGSIWHEQAHVYQNDFLGPFYYLFYEFNEAISWFIWQVNSKSNSTNLNLYVRGGPKYNFLEYLAWLYSGKWGHGGN
jgi:hypothetical protein